MASELSRDEIDALTRHIKQLLIDQEAGTIETERARHELEQIIADAAGQMSDTDRRDVALFGERTIAAFWSGHISMDAACAEVEKVISAAAQNHPGFLDLVRAAPRQGQSRP